MIKTLLILFFSKNSYFDERLTLNVNKPTVENVALYPSEPWESWAVFAYNDVLKYKDEYRMYYDCIEGSGKPPGQNAQKSFRRICFANSSDGIHWKKPKLNVYSWKNSTYNNILLEDSGVSVVHDGDSWKMITSYYAYNSIDGIKFYRMCENKSTTSIDDTKPTIMYENGQYIIYVRRDIGKNYDRQISRCVTKNLCLWDHNCSIILKTDYKDPSGVDIYTNSYTNYFGKHLLFPSFYYHFGQKNPYGFGNDGLLDIRFLASDDSFKWHYINNDRSPYVYLGNNLCTNGNKPSVHEDWCPLSELSKTSRRTSAIYMASGYVLSTDKQHIYQYISAQPFTHGTDSSKDSWGNNTGIIRLKNRLDGFTFIQSPYVFNEPIPYFITEYINVHCKHAKLLINLQTSVVGYIVVEVVQHSFLYNWKTFNQIKGSSLNATASWFYGKLNTLPTGNITLKIGLTDTRLYSLKILC